MVLEEGVILETKGRIATVRIKKSGACAHCKARCIEQDGCVVAEAENPVEAEVGDIVRLELNPKVAITASLFVFGLPLLMLVIGVILTSFVMSQINFDENNQIWCIGVGTALFFAAFIPAKKYDSRMRRTGSYSISVVEVLQKSFYNFPE